MTSSFRTEHFQEHRRALGTRFGEPLSVLASTGSTNDDALSAARANAPHGAVFIADEQTAGRGRRGNAWQSRAGDNLLMSLLLRPSLRPDQASGFALAAGLAVRDCIAPLLASPVLVKWPNDVLVSGKKLAGILIESQVQGNALTALVVGIGVNVGTREFAVELETRATSLVLLGANSTREELLASLLAALERRYWVYEGRGVAGIAADLREHDALLGKRVRVDSLVGHARGIDDQGRLIVEDDNGVSHPVLSGSVEFQAA